MQQIKVYISGKLEHAGKLAAIRQDGFHINARWIHMAETGRQSLKPVSHWQQENFDDIVAAHCFLFYVEPSDRLKGSIGEAFYAIAKNKKVWIAGNALNPGDENWGVLVKPEGAETEIRVPHKDVLPWALYRQRVRMVSCMGQAFEEMRQLVQQNRILDSTGAVVPAFEF